MQFGWLCLLLICAIALHATIIDRIAIVVSDQIIKDSDIERDIRVIDFLNQQRLDLGPKARRQAADRLISQVLIRREIRLGEYPAPPPTDAQKLLASIIKERFANRQAFEQTLRKYGLTPQQLEQHLLWQLTVLRFIDQRFRPAVLVTDNDVEQYYNDHITEFEVRGQRRPIDDVRDQIRQLIIEDRISKQFDAWLGARRRSTQIEYKEETLK
jgi:hypothetical protein